ncbi:class I SAM-dependent methyltransferase [Vulcanisaeta sp. JCM 16161]|uniref:class I SAM-dependent methyltransferase n=1 Tax=Vulcanisaeta sp. JCM 16161 TaxID=1295372 RepID=UPI0006D1BB11|nr:class I SAM-dependent methyltransferase [Vulcanisaeta sp. JCM 16161]
MSSLFYRIGVYIASKLGLYEERNIKYYLIMNRYIRDSKLILDAGCGGGFFSRTLSNQGHVVIALDIEYNVVKNVIGNNIERIQADAQMMPFRDNSVNSILAISLIEHLPQPNKFIQESQRILKRGSYLIIQIPNLQYIIEPHTKWPIIYVLPNKLRQVIAIKQGYYINFEVTIKKHNKASTTKETTINKNIRHIP